MSDDDEYLRLKSELDAIVQRRPNMPTLPTDDVNKTVEVVLEWNTKLKEWTAEFEAKQNELSHFAFNQESHGFKLPCSCKYCKPNPNSKEL